MSPGDRAEHVARLRRAVERIENPEGLRAARRAERLSLTRALDRRLGGGLSRDGLHEIVPDAPAAFGFAMALAARFMAARGASLRGSREAIGRRSRRPPDPPSAPSALLPDA